MALISFGETPCALCQKVIDKDDDLVATSHFITDPADPLCRFSDAGMHRRCFRAWDQREAFIRRFNETVGRRVWGNGRVRRMEPDGRILEQRATQL